MLFKDSLELMTSWFVSEPSYSIEIKHWDIGESKWTTGQNHRGNIYAYIRKDHPLFALLSPEGGYYDQEHINSLHLHGGCTLFEVTWAEDGTVQSYKIGSDYAHYLDEDVMASPTLPARVLNDAEALYNQLKGGSDVV